jgi:hypothetical protein
MLKKLMEWSGLGGGSVVPPGQCRRGLAWTVPTASKPTSEEQRSVRCGWPGCGSVF